MMLWLADLPKHNFASLPDSEVTEENLLSAAAHASKVRHFYCCIDARVVLKVLGVLKQQE